MADEIINKVSQSGLIEFNLEDLYPEGDRASYDLKDQLFQGLILREKDFREHIKTTDWSIYSGKYVAIYCTEDAIVPTWAYMLLATVLAPYAKKIVFGSPETLETVLFDEALSRIDTSAYRDQRVVIKGCSKVPVPVSAYLELTRLLQPLAKSIMYGEPCSTVPLFKKAKS